MKAMKSESRQLVQQNVAMEIGGCIDTLDNTFIHCASEEAECEDVGRVRWKGAIALRLGGYEHCTSDALVIGTCDDEFDTNPARCALTKDSCSDQESFVIPPRMKDGTPGGECTLEGITFDDVFLPTQYGACKDGVTNLIRCMLTPEDCASGEAWLPATAAESSTPGGCRCHEVKIGACLGGHSSSSPHCAISSDDCNFATFLTNEEAAEQLSYLDCRLCPFDEKYVPIAQNISSSEVSMESESSTSEVSMESESSSNSSSSEDTGSVTAPFTRSSGSDSKGAIVGGVAGALIVLVALVVALALYKVGKQKKKKKNLEVHDVKEDPEDMVARKDPVEFVSGGSL